MALARGRAAARQVMLALLIAGYAGTVQSVEILDEGTGMTAGVLQKPMAFIETGLFDLLDTDPKQASIVYLGPVEWDRSGEVFYVLWVQIAPGVGGHRLDDIRARGAVSLQLDDGPMALSVVELPKVTSSPYRPMVPVGDMAYFGLDLGMLRRLANSRKVLLKLRAADLTKVDFTSTQESRTAFKQFMQERGIAEEP